MNEYNTGSEHRLLFIIALLVTLTRRIPITTWSLFFDYYQSNKNEPDVNQLINKTKQFIQSQGIPIPNNWPNSRHIQISENLSKQWIDGNIHIITRVPTFQGDSRLSNIPHFFFSIGHSKVLENPKIALINSRKPRHLSPQDRWVQATKGLFSDMDHDDAAWVSSLGNYPYELVCALCAERKRPLIVVMDDILPDMGDNEKRKTFYRNFEGLFPPEQTLLLSPFMPGRAVSSKERQQVRDACVAGLADQLLVAEVRSGGNMERLAMQAGKNGRRVIAFRPNAFDRETAGNRKILASGAEPWKLPPGSAGISNSVPKPGSRALNFNGAPVLDGQFLIHFTRSCPGPWPGQGWFEYYRSITNEEAGADHTAFDTLVRILEEQKIRAQNSMIRGKVDVISFTAAGIFSARYLISWRKGLVRWTFEPYGLAIHRRVLMARGVRPVIYGDERVWKRLPRRERFRFQKYSTKGQTWFKEKEWRMAGDLDLVDIEKENLRVIVRDPHEAEVVTDRWGLATICLQASG